MCFGQVLARALLCKIVKFCQLIRYSSYSDIRKRTRVFSWPSGQKRPRRLSFGPKHILADAEELLLHAKRPWPSIGQDSRSVKFSIIFGFHPKFHFSMSFHKERLVGLKGLGQPVKILAQIPSTRPTSTPESIKKGFRPRFGRFYGEENHQKYQKSENNILFQKNRQGL